MGFKKYLQLKRAAEKLQQEWAQQRLEAEKEAAEYNKYCQNKQELEKALEENEKKQDDLYKFITDQQEEYERAKAGAENTANIQKKINELTEKLNAVAKKALDYCMKQIPSTTVAHNYSSATFVQYYYILGEKEKAQQLSDEIGNKAMDNLRYLSSLSMQQQLSAIDEIRYNLESIKRLILIAEEYNAEDYLKYYETMIKYTRLYNLVQSDVH
jgi:DNA sulfur modification protein DndD